MKTVYNLLFLVIFLAVLVFMFAVMRWIWVEIHWTVPIGIIVLSILLVRYSDAVENRERNTLLRDFLND